MKRSTTISDPVKRLRIKKHLVEEDTLKFYSNAKDPLNLLSNFSRARIVLDKETLEEIKAVIPGFFGRTGDVFESSEHLWRATQAADIESYNRLTADGDLGTLREHTMEMFCSDLSEAEKKRKFWLKKDNVGIVAKLVVTKQRKAGLRLNLEREFMEEERERPVWIAILKAKFLQNPRHRTALMCTGRKYLYEFDRGATQQTHWAGKFDKGTGAFVGQNAMGRYVQQVRDELAGM